MVTSAASARWPGAICAWLLNQSCSMRRQEGPLGAEVFHPKFDQASVDVEAATTGPFLGWGCDTQEGWRQNCCAAWHQYIRRLDHI